MDKITPHNKGDVIEERYRIIQFLGEGGLAYNYWASDDKKQGRYLVLKQLKRKQEMDGRFSEDRFQFEREYRTLLSLKHPYIPSAGDMFEQKGVLYFTREFRHGKVLKEALKNRISPARIKKIALSIISVLAYLHDQGIVYRDLKPSNILIDANDKIFMFDFGTCRYHKPGQKHDTIALGTPGFAAPEQYGKGQTDKRADIFSLGAVLYYMLTGDNPEDHPFKFEKMEEIAEKRGMPDMVGVLEKCLAMKPEDRYGDVGRLKSAILPAIKVNAAKPGAAWEVRAEPKGEIVGVVGINIVSGCGDQIGKLIGAGCMLVVGLFAGGVFTTSISGFLHSVNCQAAGCFILLSFTILTFAIIHYVFADPNKIAVTTNGIWLKGAGLSSDFYAWDEIRKLVYYKGTQKFNLSVKAYSGEDRNICFVTSKYKSLLNLVEPHFPVEEKEWKK